MRPLLHFPFLTALAALAQPASAACPTAPADASRGIEIVQSDGTVTRLTVDATGVTRIDRRFSDPPGFGEVSLSRHGYLETLFHATEAGQPVAGTELRQTYAEPVETLPILTPGQSMTLTVTLSAGTDSTTESRLFSAGPRSLLQIGDCALLGWPVRVTFAEPADGAEVFFYFEDLGTGLLLDHVEDPAAPMPDLDAVSIRVADQP